MDTKNFVMGSVAGAVTSFIAGFLFYGLALKSYLAANKMEGVMNDPPNFVLVILAHLVFGAFLCYIFQKWAGISTLVGGAKAGATIGLLFSLANAILWLGTSNIYTGGAAPALVEVLVGVVIWAAGGAGVGWALGRSKTE